MRLPCCCPELRCWPPTAVWSFAQRRKGRKQPVAGVPDPVQEFRTRFPKEWMIVSDAQGVELRERALRSQLRRYGLGAYAEASTGEAARVLLTYLKGDGGGLEVKDSAIPRAGSGLFATRRFAAGELICVYSGTVLKMAERISNALSSDYVMGGFAMYAIDAGPHPEVLARYINDALDESRLNVAFVKQKKDRVALVVATRDIASGEELYASYGQVHWRARGVDSAGGAQACA